VVNQACINLNSFTTISCEATLHLGSNTNLSLVIVKGQLEIYIVILSPNDTNWWVFIHIPISYGWSKCRHTKITLNFVKNLKVNIINAYQSYLINKYINTLVTLFLLFPFSSKKKLHMFKQHIYNMLHADFWNFQEIILNKSLYIHLCILIAIFERP